MAKRKKQRTVWTFLRLTSKRPLTFVRSGVVHNINIKKHKPFDIIRLQGKSATDDWNYWMRPDEALQWIYALVNALESWFWYDKDYENWLKRMEKLKKNAKKVS